jgi:hypothetical protein
MAPLFAVLAKILDGQPKSRMNKNTYFGLLTIHVADIGNGHHKYCFDFEL